MQIAQQITIWKLGNPWVQVIITKKKMNRLEQLPGAREEEIRIGKTLQTAPLVEAEATKEEVLKRVSTEEVLKRFSIVALVHIAAHGRMENGKIPLAPNLTRESQVPNMKGHMLTMRDMLSTSVQML